MAHEFLEMSGKLLGLVIAAAAVMKLLVLPMASRFVHHEVKPTKTVVAQQQLALREAQLRLEQKRLELDEVKGRLEEVEQAVAALPALRVGVENLTREMVRNTESLNASIETQRELVRAVGRLEGKVGA